MIFGLAGSCRGVRRARAETEAHGRCDELPCLEHERPTRVRPLQPPRSSCRPPLKVGQPLCACPSALHPCAMADPHYSLSSASSSASSNKRTYDDLDANVPSSSSNTQRLSDSVSSSNRERNKRARNDSDSGSSSSSYTTEVDEILLESANTSTSSGSSFSSYHSARSTLSPSSPTTRSPDEDPVEDIPLFGSLVPDTSYQPEPPIDISLPFTPQPSAPSPPQPTYQAAQGRDEAFRLSMERVDAFDREMAALRRSPGRPPGLGHSFAPLPPMAQTLARTPRSPTMPQTEIRSFRNSPMPSDLHRRSTHVEPTVGSFPPRFPSWPSWQADDQDEGRRSRSRHGTNCLRPHKSII